MDQFTILLNKPFYITKYDNVLAENSTVCEGGGIKQLRSEADRTHFAIQHTVRNEPIYIPIPTPPSYT
jgi:hypothetical protein